MMQTGATPSPSFFTRLPGAPKRVWRRTKRLWLDTRPQRDLVLWRLTYRLGCTRMRLLDHRSAGDLAFAELQNRLPNSGGLPLDVEDLAPRTVLASSADASRRRTSFTGFDGLALDDALAFTDPYKDLSFVPLAHAIAKIGIERHGRRNLSLLELGCGGGSLYRALRAFGVLDYLGVDANPLAFRHSPNILQSPQRFRLLNLQEPIDFGTSFDIVCTFEVLEHIVEPNIDSFLQTVSVHLTDRSLFLATTSLQDCYDVHVTVKPRLWWMSKFAEHGLRPCERSTEYESRLSRNHPFNWDATNSNVFALAREGRE